MQYFQFDNSGDMFVYEPGAGFSGFCKRVECGFEWESISSESIWSQENLQSDQSFVHSSTLLKNEEHEVKPEPAEFVIPSQR